VAGVSQDSGRWRVPPAHTALKAAATVAMAALALLSLDDRPFLLLAGVATLGLAALVVRDLLAPVRLTVDAEGLTLVTGYARRRRLPWPEITSLRVDERRRLLLHTRLLEVHTTDDLHLLSAYDLGADVRDALTDLEHARTHAAE
jgi:Bacterial PH domain